MDLRYAARTLWKTPGFTAAVVLALALGVGANTAILTVVNAVLLRPLPYPDSDRLVQLTRKFPQGRTGPFARRPAGGIGHEILRSYSTDETGIVFES